MPRPRFFELIVAAFLIVVFVQVLPFGERAGLDDAGLDAEVGGNLARQLVYVGFFLLIAAAAWRRTIALPRTAPLALMLLAAFACVSLAWSAVPDVAGRRLAATLLVGCTMVIAGIALRPARTISVLRDVTVLLAVATLVSGLVYPAGAIHLATDPEPSIVGAWRGVFYHKNIAGGAIGLGVVLCVERWRAAPRRPGAITAAAVMVLALALTRSKSAGAAAALAVVTLLAMQGAVRLSRGDPAGGVLLRAAAATTGAAAILALWFATGIGDYLLDPDAFTGRGRLWQTVAALAERRPWLGYGYASVFQVGDAGPLGDVATTPWVRNVTQSHNGLLDLWVALGIAGTLLALWALFADPWVRVARLPAAVRDEWQPLLAAIGCYVFVEALMEGGLFVAGGVKWATLTLLIGLTVRLRRATQPVPSADDALRPAPAAP